MQADYDELCAVAEEDDVENDPAYQMMLVSLRDPSPACCSPACCSPPPPAHSALTPCHTLASVQACMLIHVLSMHAISTFFFFNLRGAWSRKSRQVKSSSRPHLPEHISPCHQKHHAKVARVKGGQKEEWEEASKLLPSSTAHLECVKEAQQLLYL